MKVTYNKLVRDNMLSVYEADVAAKRTATDFSVRHLTPTDTLALLKDKLLEETQEVFEAYEPGQEAHLKEELADVIEVIDAILYHKGISLGEVLEIRDAKKARKGGFETGLYLESIDYIDGKEPR